MDEPAEHLDLPTPDALTADLLAVTDGRTTLLISHRLAALQGAAVDEIMVLHHGRIAERGSWAELVDRQGGRLRDLCPRERQADVLVAAGDGAPGG